MFQRSVPFLIGSIGLFLLARITCAADEAKLPVEKVRIPHSLIDIELVRIPAGPIEMPELDRKGKPLAAGSKQLVRIKSIWIGRTELAWEAFDIYHQRLDLTDQEKMVQYQAEADAPVAAWTRPSRPFRPVDRGFGHEGYAAISIHYTAALRFCQWLSKNTGTKYRLPTEAEWEYACRAGGPPLIPAPAALDKLAWHAGNSVVIKDDEPVPHAVATKQPNFWGLYDMLGNVGEWTMITDKLGVVKGGSYRDRPEGIHSGARELYDRNWQMTDPEDPKSVWWLSDGPHVGFRVVRED